MTDFLQLDPARLEEVAEPVKLKKIVHVMQTSSKYITVFRWHGMHLIKHCYSNTARNFDRYIAMRDRLEEIEPIPF